MTTPAPILNNCSKCGNRPILEGVRKHGRIWHSVKCRCGNNTSSVSSLEAAIISWNKENGVVVGIIRYISTLEEEMNASDLKAILDSHKAWLNDEPGGERANLYRANLYRANLAGADLTEADLTGADLTGANLKGANLYRANLYRANLAEADLAGADLAGADLAEADLTEADLTEADLTGADLAGANLYRANLTEANLYRANLYRADLTEADLTGADLTGANLTEADLTGANLKRADLRGADLTGADLRGADLDFSCWPLWCGSNHVKVDARIAAQIAAHFCALDCDDPAYLAAREAVLAFAKTSHRAGNLGLK